MNVMLLTRWFLTFLISPGMILGWVSTQLYVVLSGSLAASHDEEYLGFSALWAGVFWIALFKWVMQ